MDLSNVEYVVYNSFDAIAGAFQNIGLIFSDSGYKGLFAVAAILGIVFSGMAFYVKKVSGAQLAPLAWAMPVLVGIAIYIGLFVPKGSVTVYDEVTSKTQTFGNIPIGITATAGILNRIEKGMVDIVTTTGGSSYKVAAGGAGYEALLYMLINGYTAGKNQSIDMTLSRYIKDCLFFELNRPGTTLSVEKIRNGDISIYNALAQAVNPSVWTVNYINSSNLNGDTKSCDEAWAILGPKLQGPEVIDSIAKATCDSAGYDASNPLEYTACQSVLNNAISTINPSQAISFDQLIVRQYAAWKLQEVAISNGALPLSNYFLGKEGSSTSIALNQWIPYIKANLTAIIICLTPFLLIFVPTPLVTKVLPLTFGLFLWITIWGVTDAITHQLIIQQTAKIFEKVRQNGWGYDAIMFLPDSLLKSIGLFGYIRGAGMMLATVISGALIKMGGTAMAMFAGNLTSMVDSAAVRGSSVLTPEGAAKTASAQAEAMGKLDAVASTTFEQRRAASFGNNVWQIADGIGKGSTIGKFGFDTAVEASKNMSSYQMGKGAGFGDPQSAYETGRTESQVALGTADAFLETGNPKESAKLQTGLTKAPQGVITTGAGQNWVSYKAGGITKLSSGHQQLTLSGNDLTKVSDMPLGLDHSQLISKGYSEAISEQTAKASRLDQGIGRNVVESFTASKGTSSIESIAKKYNMSQGTMYELSNAITNIASTIGEKSQAIKDEKGNAVSKDAFMQTLAEAKAGTPFGEIAPISVSTTAQGGYRVQAQTKDGTTHTFNVSVSDRQGVEQSIGEAWRNTMQKMKSTELSANDQRAISEILQVTNTENLTEQASQSWSRVNDLQKRSSEEQKNAVTSKQDYDTAFVKWYGDKYYGSMSPEQRYAEAASDLNRLAVNAEKDQINDLFKAFIKEKALSPEQPGSKVQPPTGGPDFDKIPEMIKQAQERIEDTKQKISHPTSPPQNIREKIDQSKPDVELKKPVEKNPDVDKLKDNLQKAGKNMPREPWGMLYGGPTAKDVAEGNVPSKPPTLAEDTVDFVKRGLPHVPSDKEIEKFNKAMDNKYWFKDNAGKVDRNHGPTTQK